MMDNKWLKRLLAGCCLLVILLFIEWFLIGEVENKRDEQPIATNEVAIETIELPKLPKNKHTAASFTDMVEMPLFIEGRVPIEEENTADVKQEVKKIDDLILVGIYSVSGKVTALFRQQDMENRSLKKVEGDNVSGWLIKQIQSDKVIFEKAGKEQSMMLRALKAKTKIKSKYKKTPKKPRVNPFKKKLSANPFAPKTE